MEVPITFAPGSDPPRDVVVEFDLSTQVAELVRELGFQAAEGRASTGSLTLDGRRLSAAERVADMGMAAGSVLRADGPGPTRTESPSSGLLLAVVGGLAAGDTHVLSPGELTIGRGSGCDVVLDDELVSRLHAKLAMTHDDEIVVEDLDSANGTTVNGIEASAPTIVQPGDIVGVGSTLLSVLKLESRKADLEVTGDGHYRYNKPPRAVLQTDDSVIALPEEPPPPSGVHLPLGTVLAPLVLGPLYFLFTKQVPGLLLLMLGTPLIATFNAFLDHRSGRRSYRKKRAQYEAAKDSIGARIADAVHRDELLRRAASPDPAGVRMIATGPTSRLWERRPEDSDYLALRVGSCDQPARVKVSGAVDAGQAAVRAKMVPVTVPLGSAGVVGLAGPRTEAIAALRALLLQLAVLHSPNDVSLVILSDGNEADWDWAKWLPHTAPRRQQPCVRLFGMTARQRAARLAELATLIRDRGSRALFSGQGPHPTTVVVIDGARRLRGDEAVAHVLAEGPNAGVTAICLSEDLAGLPAETGASVVFGRSMTNDVVVTVTHGSDAVTDVVPDGVGVAQAEIVARALAPLFEVAGRSSDPSALPLPPVDQLALLEVPHPSTEDVVRRWQQRHRAHARAVIGFDPAGPFTVDLARDGPHVLIAGTTGAGKSELLQSLVTSMALNSRPEALAFLLVDFKGRSAFKDCERLPHTVGVLSNLDERMVGRGLDAIQAELRWREMRFSEAGARDFEEYERVAGTGERIPRLVVVVDELKELVDAYAASIPRLNQTARLGRGLGVHLVLATQKPASVPGLADLRANTDLRICLRVQDESDSRDIAGVPDAARIPRGAPGRGFARLSDGRIVPFQAGYLGDPIIADADDDRVPVSARAFDAATVGNSSTAPAGRGTFVGIQPQLPTKLQLLVGAMVQAARELATAPSRLPWLPPLPDTLKFDDPRIAVTTGEAAFPIGLMDLPAQQRQEPLVLDFERSNHVLVIGRTRSGRTTVLRTLAGVVAARTSPADVHLYGLEFRRRSLQDLEQLPHCGAVTGADDPERMQRLLDFLRVEIERRGRLMGSSGSLREQRERARHAERLPYILVLCDNYESFYERFSYEDGGHLIERFDWVLREGPARGVHLVVTTDQRAALHRLASAVEAQLVLRPTDQEALALGLPVHTGLSQLPPGRGFWMAGHHEVQVALLSPSPSGESESRALAELAEKAGAAARGTPADLLPARVGAMPDTMTTEEAEALRRRAAPAGKTVATFTVGGLEIAPLDVDLRAGGSTFTVAGPRGSGRSTALLSLVSSLRYRSSGDALPMCIVAPRRSPLRQLAGADGITVLTSSVGLASELVAAMPPGSGPSVLVVDDAELLIDHPVAVQLDELVKNASDDDRIVVIGGTTTDLVRRFSGWTFQARQSRSGLLLQPTSATDGEVLDVRLQRSTGSIQLPVGRGYLVVRGRSVVAQVTLPVPPVATVA